jgi:hypothetical protein
MMTLGGGRLVKIVPYVVVIAGSISVQIVDFEDSPEKLNANLYAHAGFD